jgi:Tol biopolymer transport system component
MITSSSVKDLFIMVITLLLVQCSRDRTQFSISYPKPLPDSIALPFLPGIVTGDSLDFNSAFSRDGKRFYFARSVKGKWRIFMSEFVNGAWRQLVLAPFTEAEYSQADPFITADGTLYYISNRPRNAEDTIPDYDIWYIRPQSDGSWSKPVNVEAVNSDSTEYFVSLADNGNLYFASNRTGTIGSHDIYVSKYVNGGYSTPENLGAKINSPQMEHDPVISPDEQFLIFTSVDRTDTFGSADLYYSLHNDDGTWTPAKNMGDKFNTDTYEYCSYLTPDGQYLFYSTDYDVKWISTKHFPWKVR